MAKRVFLYYLSTLLTITFCYGQETEYGFGFQTIITDNPAITGCEGDGIMRLSYMNHFPGKNYDLQSFFVSYDIFLPVLHGGIGAYVSNDYLGGIMNDLRGGFSYSYHLQADKDFFINAGLSASFFHRGFNLNNVILPDQIDPLSGYTLPSAESPDIRGHTAFDIGTGVMVFADWFFGGFSISHLAQPLLDENGSDIGRLQRKYSMHLAGRFSLDKNELLNVVPVIFGKVQGSVVGGGAGVAFEAGIISLSAMVMSDNNPDINLRTGFSIRKGSVKLLYNYTFNLLSENSQLPFSLMHQAGLAVGLYNVDKRKIIKTINFPIL